MGAKEQFLRDLAADRARETPRSEHVRLAKIQTAKFYAIVKERKQNLGMISITDAAEALGVSRYSIKVLADKNKVRVASKWFTAGYRTYQAKVVDVNECRAALAAKEARKPKPKKRALQRGNFETPPPDKTALRDVVDKTAIGQNTLLSWIHRGHLDGKKYVTHRPGRHGWEWYVDFDEAIELFKKRRATRWRNNFRQTRGIEMTQFIRELWEVT